MKLKSILLAGILVSVLATSNARADDLCSLTVSPSSYILVGQSFSYGININGPLPLPSPLPPGWVYPGPPFTVVFYGSKNGVDDIPLSGEYYPGTFGYFHSDLTGYWNPGGLSGTYLRYAKVYSNPSGSTPPGNLYCTTNTVAVVLQ